MLPKVLTKPYLFLQRNRTLASIAGVLLLAALGFYALHRLLAEIHLRDLRAALRAMQGWQLIAAFGLTSASYLLLTLYDALALRIIGKPLPWRTAALASFASYTLSHNLGMALLTGGSARYRIYSAKGLAAADIARIIATASMTFWMGVIAVSGAALMLHPVVLALGPLHIPADIQRWCGFGILAAMAGLLFLARKPGQSLRLLGWSLPLPTAGQAAAQVLVAGLDLAVASAALFVLVPGADSQIFPAFFLAYALAIIAALITHVPGGIGIFEAVIIAALPKVDKTALLAALVAYRAIYHLLPLLLASILLAIHEHRLWRSPVASALRLSQSVVSGIAPEFMAVLAFAGGAILLVSGSLPALPHRLSALRHMVPLPFVEASHIAASLAGTGLLLLAPGLFKRLDGAFILTRMMLIAGAAFSLAKGLDYEEATILLIIAGVLQWSRASFYRHTAFTARTLSAGWLAAVAVALGLALWIGIFSYKHVAYQSDLWWQFAWKGDASRFLRAGFAVAVLFISAVLVNLFNPAPPRDTPDDFRLPDKPDAFACNDRTEALLAWTGDKRFLWSPGGDAFLMYQVQGRSWIVMGDPVGPREQWPDLLWQLRESADAAQGRLLLYQITPEVLPIAVDLGLQLIKYGEAARVDLRQFSLEGPEAKALRHSERRALREGAEFAIIRAADLASIMPELRAISDDWLQVRGQTEKAFSVGRFDPAYMSRFDCAVVRKGGRIVAFANIWATSNKNELSVDLMRHAANMPYGTMDFLFIRLMQWGREQGFRWFSLGMAPLAGIEARRLAPVWARVSALLYRHGDSFYGFEGLRAYKDKFAPEWEPRFAAGPQGIGLVRALIDLQALIGGGRTSAARRRLAVAA